MLSDRTYLNHPDDMRQIDKSLEDGSPAYVSRGVIVGVQRSQMTSDNFQSDVAGAIAFLKGLQAALAKQKEPT